MDYQTKVYGGNSNGDPSEKIVIKSNGEAESPRGGFSLPLSGEEKRKGLSESKFQRALKSPVMSGTFLRPRSIRRFEFLMRAGM